MPRLPVVVSVLALSVLAAESGVVGEGARDATSRERTDVPWFSCRWPKGPVLKRAASAGAVPAERAAELGYPRISRYGYNHPGAWAEGYLARREGGLFLHLLFSQNVRRHAERIKSFARRPQSLRFFRAHKTIRELERLQKHIGEEQFRDPPRPYLGAEVSGTDIEVKRNLVRTYLRDYSRQAARRFKERYGPRSCVNIGDADVRPESAAPGGDEPAG